MSDYKFIEETAELICNNVCRFINRDTCSKKNDELKVDSKTKKLIFKKPLMAMEEVKRELLSRIEAEKATSKSLEKSILDYNEKIHVWKNYKKNIVSRISSNPEIQQEDQTLLWNGERHVLTPMQKILVLSFFKLYANTIHKEEGIDSISISRETGESVPFVHSTLSRFSDRELFVRKDRHFKDIRWFPLLCNETIKVENRNSLQANMTLPPTQELTYNTLKTLEKSGPKTSQDIANIRGIDVRIVNNDLFRLKKKGLVVDTDGNGERKTWITLPRTGDN